MESTNEDIQILAANLKRKKGKDSNSKQWFKKQRDYCKMQCYRCDNYGHTAEKCPDKLKHQASFAEVSNSNLDSMKLVF